MSGRGNRAIHGLSWSLGDEYYQFYCTAPNALYAETTLLGGDVIYQYYGSAVAVKIPKRDSNQQLNPLPTGSSREIGTDFRSEIANIDYMNTEMFRVNGIRQMQGITEHPYYVTRTLDNGEIKRLATLHCAWVTPDGHTPFSGAYLPQVQFLNRDILYDLKPSYQKAGSRLVRAPIPDTDWYQRACIQVVTSEQYGARTFIIMESADGYFHCWPLSATQAEGLANPIYEAQSIKTNISNAYVKSVLPNYPAWVYRGAEKRSTFITRDNRETLDPRYLWYFSKDGTRAITAMVERDDIELNYNRITVTDIPQEELETEVSIKIQAEKAFYSEDETVSPVKQDRLGLVELSFQILLTGENLDEFSFTPTVINYIQPQNNDSSRLISVAYAMPTNWSRFAGGIGQIQPDDIIEARLYVYAHPDYESYKAAMDGNYGTEYPNQAIVVITNITQSTELLRFAGQYVDYNDERVSKINAGTFLSQFFNTSFLAKFSYFDLSSLSFHYTVTGSQLYFDPTVVEETETYNRYIIKKRSRLRNNVYAFGQLVNTQEIGHSSISIDSFIANTQPQLGFVQLPVNSTSTIRGTYTGPEQQFWWLRAGLDSAFCAQFYRHWYYEKYGTSEPGFPPNSYSPALSAITEESFYDDYMMKLYNGITDVQQEIGTRLSSMNVNFDLEMWETEIQWLLWKVFVLAREAVAESTLDWDAGVITTIFLSALKYFYAGATSTFLRLYKSPLNEASDDIIVRNYPYGELVYAKIIKYMFSPIDSINGKVLVHPDGHCSAFYKKQLICGKDYIPNYTIRAYKNGDLFNLATLGLNIKDYADPGNSATALFDSMVIDYVSFWDGQIETTHNNLYNTAYNHSFNLSSYYPTLQMAETANEEFGVIQDGLYVPLHFINATFLSVLSPVYPQGYYSTPPGVSATRLSAAFV